MQKNIESLRDAVQAAAARLCDAQAALDTCLKHRATRRRAAPEYYEAGNGYRIYHHGKAFRLEDSGGDLIAVFTYLKGARNVAEMLSARVAAIVA